MWYNKNLVIHVCDGGKCACIQYCGLVWHTSMWIKLTHVEQSHSFKLDFVLLV